MNETIAFRPEGRASIKDVVVNYTLASLDELEQLHPALNLLACPSIVRGSHDFFVRCYDSGVQHAQAGAAETVAVCLIRCHKNGKGAGCCVPQQVVWMPCASR